MHGRLGCWPGDVHPGLLKGWDAKGSIVDKCHRYGSACQLKCMSGVCSIRRELYSPDLHVFEEMEMVLLWECAYRRWLPTRCRDPGLCIPVETGSD
jgi:hypothetical protein